MLPSKHAGYKLLIHENNNLQLKSIIFHVIRIPLYSVTIATYTEILFKSCEPRFINRRGTNMHAAGLSVHCLAENVTAIIALILHFGPGYILGT